MKRFSRLILLSLFSTLAVPLPAQFSSVAAHSIPGNTTTPGSKPTKPMDHHQTKAIPPGQAVPTVKLIVRPDAMKGWNLQLQVTNFKFAPERINQSSDVKEGHAHLYINGQKVARLYSPWYYLDNLKPGRYEIKVTLNTNKHEDLTAQGKTIADTVILEVPAAR